MAEYFGIVDGVDADGYVEQTGDVLILTFKRVTHFNEEKELVVSFDRNSALRLRAMLDERVTPKREDE